MDSKTYIQNAIRTESQIPSIELDDAVTFEAVVNSFIASSMLLDLYKKNIFYGKPIDQSKWNGITDDLKKTSQTLSNGSYINLDKPQTLNMSPRVFHAIVGIATESGELMETILTHLHHADADSDIVNIGEELGDFHWYEAILLDELDIDRDSIDDTNIAKLRKRYPDKFDSERAINRDVDAERKILEDGTT